MTRPSLFRATLLLVAAIAAVPAVAHADVVRLASAVDAVTLYPTGASVHRAGRAELDAGDHEVVFGPLPVALTDDSLRVGGVGHGATIQGVTVRTGRMIELTGPTVEQLAGEVDAAERDLARLRGEHAELTRARAVLEAQRAPAQRVGVVVRALADLERRVQEAARRHAQRAAQLASARAEGERPVKFATVDVTTAQRGELELTLAYQIPGHAAWSPTYAAHLEEGGARVALDVFAAVQQNTGEDWQGVRLALSTVAPAQGLAIPRLEELAIELEPEPEADRGNVELHLYARRGMPAAAGRAAMPDAEAPMPMPPDGAPRRAAPRPVEVATGHARANLLSARIEVPGAVTLRSGAPPRRVLAAHHAYDVRLEHHAVPRASQSVFVTARFANAAPFPLLGGNVALFLGAEYVGTAPMPPTNVGDEVALPFGVDAGVSIERSLADRRVARSGARDETTLRYDFRLTNHRDRAVTVDVLDQLPVSRSAGLTVRTLASTRPTSARRDGAVPGAMRWQIQATPGSTHRWSMGYVVSAPHRRAVSGSIE